MLVRIANREDPDQTASSETVSEVQSDLGLPCLSRLLWQANTVQNFRTFTVDTSSYTCTEDLTSDHFIWY